jgi:hypothetical protein
MNLWKDIWIDFISFRWKKKMKIENGMLNNVIFSLQNKL